jgi:hypothetical protein
MKMKKLFENWRTYIVENQKKIYSFDFDNTLITYKLNPENPEHGIYDKPHEENISLLKKLVSEGNEVLIVTSRKKINKKLPWDTAPSPEQLVKELSLPVSSIHYTNGDLKAETLTRLGVEEHWDDEPAEIKAAERMGIKAHFVPTDKRVFESMHRMWANKLHEYGYSVPKKLQKYLTEGMRMPEDLPKNIFVTIEVDGDDHYVYYSNKDAVMLTDENNIKGAIYLGPTKASVDGGQCLDGLVIGSSEATQGWGPMLYDVAIEHSSMVGGGLIPDRNQVSEQAYDVWEYYHDNRDDVKKIQLDDPENTLTTTDKDNCAQDSAVDASEMYFDDPEITWQDTPLSKIYIKKDMAMINKLDMLGKLIKRGV